MPKEYGRLDQMEFLLFEISEWVSDISDNDDKDDSHDKIRNVTNIILESTKSLRDLISAQFLL